jgi:hypothetical protein
LRCIKLAGDGNPATHPQCTVGTRAAPDTIAGKIFTAAAKERRLLLPDSVSRLSWFVSRLAPQSYARQMAKKLGREMECSDPDCVEADIGCRFQSSA